MKYDVISAGEPVIDFVPVDTQEGLVYRAYPGGGAVNVLAEVCAMGGNALLLGVVGQDHFGEFLLEEVKKRGIDVSGIYRTVKRNTGIGFVRLSQEGDGTILDRRELLMKQKERLALQIEAIQKTMERLEYKISCYDKAMGTGRLVWD